MRTNSSSNTTLSSKLIKFYHDYGVFEWLVLGALGIGVLLLDRLCRPSRRLINSYTDPNLSYPYTTQTCPNFLLIILSVIVPFVAFTLHYVYTWYVHKVSINYVAYSRTLLYFCYALIITVWLTTWGKKWIGRPRPNFYAYSQIYNATQNEFGEYSHQVQDAFQSFPSGHASLSFAGLGYLALFLYHHVYLDVQQKRKKDGKSHPHNNSLLYFLLSISPLLVAFWISLSRIRDYWHFFEDVLTGAVIGSAVTYTIFKQYWNYKQSMLNQLSNSSVNAGALSGASASNASVNSSQMVAVQSQQQHAVTIHEYDENKHNTSVQRKENNQIYNVPEQQI